MVYISKSVVLKLNQGASPSLFVRARELRRTLTDTERIVWNAIRSGKCNGLKFRRQHPIERFILDFYCHEYLLAIEIDGGIHLMPHHAEYDSYRTSILNDLGIKVLRFTNEEVINDLDAVLLRIQQAASNIHPHKENEEGNPSCEPKATNNPKP
jgi:very-short-patch-repair endonuclease